MTDPVPTETPEGREVWYDPDFLPQIERWVREAPPVARRIVELVEQAILTPGRGLGRPKRLGVVPGLWSRRITKTHRLFYLVTDDELRFVSCRGHEPPNSLVEAAQKGRIG